MSFDHFCARCGEKIDLDSKACHGYTVLSALLSSCDLIYTHLDEKDCMMALLEKMAILKTEITELRRSNVIPTT